MSNNPSYDVVVVGSGGGALTGAYTAAMKGLSVAVIEATDRIGGTTAYSGGGTWFPNNAVLRRAGNIDSVEEAKAYYHAVVGDRTPRDLQDAFVETGSELVEFLESNPLLQFQVYPWPDYYGMVANARPEGRHIIPREIAATEMGALAREIRSTIPVERAGFKSNGFGTPDDMLGGGQALIGRLRLALERLDNVDVYLRTELQSLKIVDGRVRDIGALVDGEKRVTFTAHQGVILAAGGFERNDEMRRRFGIPTSAAWSMGSPGNQGKAHQAAIDIGADTDLMEDCWWAPGLLNPDGTTWFVVGIQQGLMVNAAGRRFADETLPYDRLGREMLADHGPGDARELRCWFIFDDRMGGELPLLNTTIPVTDKQPYVAAGLWKSAPSLEELAAGISVDADVLHETVARFNRFAATGYDEDFGRGCEPYGRFFATGGNPNPTLIPVDQGPFHAVAMAISDLGTKGGLRTNVNGQVLDSDGNCIPGLYAAGNTMAAVSGHAYPAGGNPIGSSMVFAYRAALDIAGSPSDGAEHDRSSLTADS